MVGFVFGYTIIVIYICMGISKLYIKNSRLIIGRENYCIPVDKDEELFVTYVVIQQLVT